MSIETELALELRSLFAPRPETTVTEWAEQNVFLPATVTQRSGQYSTSHCAYIRELLEDFRNPAVSESTNCFAAQVYKTTAVFVGMAYRLDQQPASMIFALPSIDLASKFSQRKWQPMIESSPALLRHKLREQDKFKILFQQFDASTVYFIGGGSESQLKGISAEIIVIDEIDDVEAQWQAKGMSGVSMLEERAKSFAGRKIIRTGTPTEVTGAVWKAYLNGDRRLFFVTCPVCQGQTHRKPFAMEFEPERLRDWFPDVLMGKVVWDKTAKKADGSYNLDLVQKSAAMECPCCKAHLGQEKLPAMVAAGRWMPTNKDSASGKPSRRLPSLYSPHEECTLGKLAVKFLESKSDAGKLRNFLNHDLAVPHLIRASTTTETDIKAIISHSLPYERGTIPKDDIALLCMTVDVNQDVLHWLIRAWFGDGSSSLVDYGKLLPSWTELLELSKKTYRTPKGLKVDPLYCLIDSGYRTKSENGVYDFCLRTNNRFIPIKGSGIGRGLTKTVQQSQLEHKGRRIDLVQFDDNILKQELYLNTLKRREAGNWSLPRNMGRDYEEQLTDEYLDTDKTPAKWEDRGNNHLGDCEKYQLIIPSFLENMHGKNGLRLLADLVASCTKLDPIALAS